MNSNQIMQSAANALRQGQYHQAIKPLKAVLETQPDLLQARWLLVQAFEGLQQPLRACEQIDMLLAGLIDDLPAINQLAAHVLQRGYPLNGVLRSFAAYLARHPGSAEAAFNYAYHLARDAQFETAIKKYTQALKLGIARPEEVHLNIANIYMDHLHDNKKAKSHLNEALALNPRYVNAWFNLGNLAERRGQRDKAKSSFEKCLQLDPLNHTALARLADTHKFESLSDPMFERLNAALRRSDNSDVYFALARAHEQCGDFESAWQNYTTANRLDAGRFPPYNRPATENLFQQIKSRFTAQWLEKYQGKSHDTVFICGMFRTGSTLLEQILAAHPNFYPGGESEFFPRLIAKHFRQYPDGMDHLRSAQLLAWKKQQRAQSSQLAAGNRRLTDKRPDNFLYLGLIKAVLPSAKFVVTQRDWRDVATSIFCTRLGPQQNYATSLSNIRHYLNLQQDLIDHWSDLFGEDLMRLDYEKLVTEPRVTISRLLNDLGESWDERCLSFNRLDNTVKTASVWQVREPLSTKSVARWKNYSRHFEDVFGDQVASQNKA